MKLQKVNRKHVSYVELERDGRTPIGLSIKDGSKYGLRPLIKNIKDQSLSHRSHCVSEGDVLLSLCGEDSLGLSKKEVRRRLKTASSRIDITLQYESREPSFDNFGVYRYERITLRLRKESGSFGFILRKNDTSDSASSEYPTITNIRPGGPADKEKCLQDGDRLLKIDDQSLSWLSLSEVSNILKEKHEAVFLIEYNVRIVDFCANVGAQNEIYIDCLDDLGMILGSAMQGTKLQIQEIRQGSLAHRCGVFKQGDIIERINDIDTALLTSSKANNILQRFKKESGTLVFIPYNGGQGLLQRLNPNVIELVENKNRCIASNPPPSSQASQIKQCSKMCKLPNTRTQLKQTSSIDLPHNVPSSSKSTNFPANHSSLHIPKNRSQGNQSSTDTPGSLSTPDPYSQTISILTDVVRNVSKLGYFVSYFEKEAERTDKTNTSESPNKSTPQENCINVNPVILSQLKSVYVEAKKSTYDLALHVTNHHKIFPWDVGESKDQQLNSDKSSDSSINDLKPQVIDGLLELERKNLLTKDSVVNLKRRLDAMKTQCKRCYDVCISTFYLIQKIRLLSSFNGFDLNSQEICSLVEEVENIRTTCKDCRRNEHQADREVPVHNHPVASKYHHTLNQTSVLCNDQQNSKPKNQLNQLSNNPDTPLPLNTETDISNSELPTADTTVESSPCIDLNIKVGNSDLNPTNTRKPLDCKVKNEPNQEENISNWVNYSKNSDGKVHKGKDCFQMPMKTFDSERFSSCDENELETPDLETPCSNVSNSSSTRVKRPTSSKILEGRAYSCNESSSDLLRNTQGPFGLTSVSDKWETTSECFSSASFKSASDRGSLLTPMKARTSTEVKLKDEGFGFGLDVEHCSTSESKSPRTIITALDSLGAAKKCGIIHVGDRLLEVNGLNLVGLPITLLDSIFQQSLKAKEVLLKVEFEVTTPNIKEGTFDVLLEKNLKCGLIFEGGDSLPLEPRMVPEFRKGAPLIVRGIVVGSAAHRSGLMFPGDEVLSVRSIKEESYESLPGNYKRQDWTVFNVRRSCPPHAAISETGSEGSRSSIPALPFVVHRSTVRSVIGRKGRVIDHELTLFRDAHSEFGFGIKQNPNSGNVYVSELRKGGPAEASKVIQVEDRILESPLITKVVNEITRTTAKEKLLVSAAIVADINALSPSGLREVGTSIGMCVIKDYESSTYHPLEKVNGTIIGRNNKSYVIKKFKEDKDFIDLITRRILE